jgi:DNA gyrase/topoisomerase IV subunit A
MATKSTKTKTNLTKKITGFDAAEAVKTDGNGHFLLAFCTRNNGDDIDISPWFTEQGTFNACRAAYTAIHQLTDYQNETLDMNIDVFTIFYELNDTETEALRVVNEVTLRKKKVNITLRDLVSLDKDLEPFEVEDYVEPIESEEKIKTSPKKTVKSAKEEVKTPPKKVVTPTRTIVKPTKEEVTTSRKEVVTPTRTIVPIKKKDKIPEENTMTLEEQQKCCEHDYKMGFPGHYHCTKCKHHVVDH